MTTRRTFLRGGCAAAALSVSAPADAARASRRTAPRLDCGPTGCRHHRPGDRAPGICGLALRWPAAGEVGP